MAERELLVYFDETRDPVENLAREEELFERVDSGTLPELARFWVNSECLVRGKARSAKYGWYNEGLARKMGVPVIIRETGGGVVYHDEGNLNWSFFLRTSGAFLSPTAAFDLGSKYMVRALQSLGVRAQFSPPNRIDVSGRKVSGMAAKSSVRALLVHGTLLLNSNLEKLNLLCVPPEGCPLVSNLSEWAKSISAASVARALVGVLEDSGFHVRTIDAVK
ncbi:MAG: lipoate--protein ligase family protein [Nitrososphaerota archaeon]|nr:lipoate--protein ligase family protein [Nitrososphaerota archaeon]